MKKYLFMALMAAVTFSFNGCKDGPAGNGGENDKEGGSGEIEKEAITEQLSPEGTKEHLMKIANGLVGKFNTNDQKAALELMDGMIEKYETYDWEPFEDYFETTYDELFAGPRYVRAVLKGESPVPAMNHAYTFSFAGESMVWEADDQNRTWVNVGPASDNSIILRAKDKNGTMCEAKIWGTGSTKTYEVTWDEDGESYTAKGIVPEMVHFTLTQGSKQIVSADLKQDMQRNDHATFNVEAKVVNLRWTVDMNIHSTYGSVGFAFYYGNESLLSALINLPSYQLIPKDNSTNIDSYQNWVEEYADQYDYLISQIGNADAIVDIFGMAQGKINITNGGQAYATVRDLDRQGVPTYTEQGAQQYCDAINNAQTNGIYFNSDIKQADVRMMVMEQYGEYSPEPVLYFPIDGTSYSFEQYFNRKPFTDLQQSIETLANNYIKISSWLTNNVGEIHF